ncbi:MAG: DUF934 domain-containing protein, partial [Limnobacter sp.]|nr:DUF934 domain-containing protein [Limnobacter sp.]
TARLVEDDFQVVQLEDSVPSTGKVLLPLDVWLAEKDVFKSRAEKGEVGVWLSPDEGPEALADEVNTLPVVAFYFPEFKFGQAYSSAFLLRQRLLYKGEIRAFGGIWRDQLFYLARCGFTQFSLKEGKSLEDALESFTDFTTPYQTSADGALPIFTRRTA